LTVSSPTSSSTGQLALLPAPFEQRLEGGAEIVNDLVGEVEPGCDSREDELGDVLEALV
jgi:hypothetical protein